MLIVPTFKSTPFMFQAQHISSHHEPFMYHGLPIHIVIMPLSYQPFQYNLMQNSCQPFIHNSQLAFLYHTHTYQAFNTDTQNQANIIHTRPRKTSHITLSRSAPRLGWRVSLRRDRLAQASPPSPRRGLEKNQGHEQRGISLKRDPSRLGELPARSKVERAAWATFRAEALGELPVSSRLGETDSPGRD